jgi:hypothetical protein
MIIGYFLLLLNLNHQKLIEAIIAPTTQTNKIIICTNKDLNQKIFNSQYILAKPSSHGGS